MPAQHNILLLMLHAFISCHFYNHPFTAAAAISQNIQSNFSPDLSSIPIRPQSTKDTDCVVNDEESKWNLHGIPGDGYYITAHIGTPPQPINLLVDTGSSNLAVAGSNDDQVDTYFKPNFSSSFMMFSNSHLRVAYTQGWWEGFLGSDVVVLPSLSCHLETRSFVALIRRSHGFYVTGSHWQGILGLAFPELAQPNKSIQPWFESLLSTHNSTQHTFALHTNDSVDAMASSYQQHVQERQSHSNNLTISAEESHPSAIVASSFLVPGLPYSSDDNEEHLPLLRSVVNKVRLVSNGSFRNNSFIITNMSNPKSVDKKPYVKSNFTRSNFNLETIKVQLAEDDINIFNQSNLVEYTTVKSDTRLLLPVLDSDGVSDNIHQSNSHLLSKNDKFNSMRDVNSVSNVSGSSHENESHKYKVTNENKMGISSRPLVVVENSQSTNLDSNLLSKDEFKDRNVTDSSNQIMLDSNNINRSYTFNKATNTDSHNNNKKKGHGDGTKRTVEVHQSSGFTKSSRSVLSNTFGLELCGPWSSPTHDTHMGRIVLGANVESCGSGPWLEAPILQPWFYEVAVAGMAVGGKPLALPCTLYNTHASIVDSGTTKLKLPDKVLDAVLSVLESASQALPEPLPANFWRGGGSVCWTQAHTAWSVLPSITVQLAISNTSIVSISLGPRSYLRPAPPVPDTAVGLEEKFGYVDDLRSDTSSMVPAEENLNETLNLKQSDSGVEGTMAYTAVSDGHGTQASDEEYWTANASLVSSLNVTNSDIVFELSDRNPSLVINDKHILDSHKENNGGEVPEVLAVSSGLRQPAVTAEVYNEETPSGVTELISSADSDAYDRSMLISKVRMSMAHKNSDTFELNIGGWNRTADAHLDVNRENGRINSNVLNLEASQLAVDGVTPSASSPSFARDPGLPPVPCWTSGIEASNMGTVLGVVVLEGLCVRFDRERGMLGFRRASCGPVVEVTGPHQHQGAGACVSSSHGGGAGTTVLAALLAVLCCPLLLYAARCLYITLLRRRRRASGEAADEDDAADANGSAGTPFLVLDDNPAVV